MTIAMTNWELFCSSLLEPTLEWRDELDLHALLALKGGEREAAEELLLEHLGGEDYRLPAALAAMKSTLAPPALEARLPTATGHMRISTARALVELGVLPSMDDAIAKTIVEPDERGPLSALVSVRMQGRPSPALEAVLLEVCMNHPQAVVRGETATTLLWVHGVARDPSATSHVQLRRPFYLEDRGLRQLSHDELRRLIAGSRV